MKKFLTLVVLIGLLISCSDSVNPSTQGGANPSAQQSAWDKHQHAYNTDWEYKHTYDRTKAKAEEDMNKKFPGENWKETLEKTYGKSWDRIFAENMFYGAWEQYKHNR